MHVVADPAPALALTISSPPNCTPGGTCQRHAKSGSTFRLTVRDGFNLLLCQLHRRLRLADKRQDRGARVSANNRDFEILWVLEAQGMRGEGRSADDIKGRHAEDAGGVKDSMLAERLDGNGNGAVDGVRNDADEGLGAE